MAIDKQNTLKLLEELVVIDTGIARSYETNIHPCWLKVGGAGRN